MPATGCRLIYLFSRLLSICCPQNPKQGDFVSRPENIIYYTAIGRPAGGSGLNVPTNHHITSGSIFLTLNPIYNTKSKSTDSVFGCHGVRNQLPRAQLRRPPAARISRCRADRSITASSGRPSTSIITLLRPPSRASLMPGITSSAPCSISS